MAAVTAASTSAHHQSPVVRDSLVHPSVPFRCLCGRRRRRRRLVQPKEVSSPRRTFAQPQGEEEHTGQTKQGNTTK